MPKPSVSPATMGADRVVPLYRVVLLDDNDHTYDYIIEMLQQIFIFTMLEGYRHAEELERCGRTVLIVCELREAEFARDQIHAYGSDWRLPRSQGSMTAVIEPA
jgi:ATP-dependent Clp protease adaptor protein ClpS